ncbi:MAG: ferritin-like domain-containing protein, partial [Actinomycetota bacterium]|nr:ferritin-like domain-containing protein [Actinomycetota bacterium]
FILRSAFAVGTVYSAGAIGPYVKHALAQSEAGDIDVLNFALTLELLETAFYKRALGLQLSGAVAEMAETFGTQEAEHVSAIRETIAGLGGKPEKAPKFSFPLRNEASFLALAQTLEETGVSAYNGAAPQIQSPEVLAAAGQIVQIEARHAAAIRTARGQAPAPRAFDKALGMEQVLQAAKPFIKA